MTEEVLTDITSKLKNELATVAWEHLKPHLDRDALIVVDSNEDIISVATDIANDNTETITSLVSNGKLSKPDNTQIKEWNQSGQSFSCLIVSPYILIQLS